MLSAVPLRCCYTGNPRCEAAADTETSDCEANIGYLVFYNVVSFSTITESNICALDALLCHFPMLNPSLSLCSDPRWNTHEARARARVCVCARARSGHIPRARCLSFLCLSLSLCRYLSLQ